VSWTKEISALRRELVAYFDQRLANAFVWTRTANTSALGKEDAVETGDDDSQKGQRPVRRVEPFGLRSRPPAKQRSFSLRLGSSTVIYLGVASDGGYGPGDLEDGELALYSKNVPKALHARDDGKVAINGDTFSALETEGFMSAFNTFADDLLALDPLPPTVAALVAELIALATTLKASLVANNDYKSDLVKHG
jgi:hypothetical protein